MKKQIIEMTLDELKAYREDLVNTYIGEMVKPYWYYDKLKDIDILIKHRK